MAYSHSTSVSFTSRVNACRWFTSAAMISRRRGSAVCDIAFCTTDVTVSAPSTTPCALLLVAGRRRMAAKHDLVVGRRFLDETDVLSQCLHVRIRAAEMCARELVGAAQVLVETPGRALVEGRRLAKQVVGRFEHDHFAAFGVAARHAARDEFRIQPVAAFLEITAVRHL